LPCQDVVHSLFGFTGSADDETLVSLQHLKPVLDIGCIVAEAFLRFSVQSLEVFLKFFSFPTAIHLRGCVGNVSKSYCRRLLKKNTVFLKSLMNLIQNVPDTRLF